MEIITASLGFCIGIDRTYRKMNEWAAAEPALHAAHQHGDNPNDTLRRIDLKDPELFARYPALEKVSVTYDISTLRDGDRLVTGFHGLPETAKRDLAARGVALVEDLVCPFIAKLDRVVERLAEQGFDIAIVGKNGNHHCETARDLASQHGRRCFVIEQPEDTAAILQDDGRPMALVGQVTGNTVLFGEAMERVRASGKPVKIVKTMCSDSYVRQDMAIELARSADLVLLADDGGGALLSVHEACAGHSRRIHRVRSAADIKPEWFEGVGKVAIIGGIMMPVWTIEEIAKSIREMFPDRPHETNVMPARRPRSLARPQDRGAPPRAARQI